MHRAAGIGTVEGALRLRFEIRREFAPYVGVVWERQVGATDRVQEQGGVPRDRRFVLGARVWF